MPVVDRNADHPGRLAGPGPGRPIRPHAATRRTRPAAPATPPPSRPGSARTRGPRRRPPAGRRTRPVRCLSCESSGHRVCLCRGELVAASLRVRAPARFPAGEGTRHASPLAWIHVRSPAGARTGSRTGRPAAALAGQSAGSASSTSPRRPAPPRYVSFVETGQARPSREMVLRLPARSTYRCGSATVCCWRRASPALPGGAAAARSSAGSRRRSPRCSTSTSRTRPW